MMKQILDCYAHIEPPIKADLGDIYMDSSSQMASIFTEQGWQTIHPDSEYMEQNRMTNEKASVIIGNIPVYGDECYSIAEYQEAKTVAVQALSQESSRDIEEIAEIMRCAADAETKLKMISNILSTKSHYFELSKEPEKWTIHTKPDGTRHLECSKAAFKEVIKNDINEHKHDPCETCGYAEGSPACLQYCPYDAERKKEQKPYNDILTSTKQIAIQVTEDIDNFIFTTIKPWCEEKVQQKISKCDLEQALTQYFSKEPCDKCAMKNSNSDYCKNCTIIEYHGKKVSVPTKFVEQEPCDNAVSRSGAIKAIEERAKRIKNEDTLNGLAGAVGVLFELPPVTPTCEEREKGECPYYAR